MIYRSTAHSTTGVCQAILLFKRKKLTMLPKLPMLLTCYLMPKICQNAKNLSMFKFCADAPPTLTAVFVRIAGKFLNFPKRLG